MTTEEKAIRFIKKNKTWSDAEEKVALDRINFYRSDLRFASPEIADQIYDLLEEFGADNDLPENWWAEYGDEDYFFMKL